MLVLSTDRAELKFFSSPEAIPEGYAALSHTWNNTAEDGPPEQSFQEVQEIREDCEMDGRNPRDIVSEKIRRCCELAETHGYKWVWIDTCCIDKTSSAELSEAINSMIRYYSLAGICFGYLRDVPFFTDIRDVIASYTFRCSIWFRRGWTLQEVIAPRVFLFICRSWQVLGSKADFACFLERCTNIPATVLRSEVSHTTFSIAQRMSWFGERRTTREEDEAYSLLGLFDVNIPIIYGEGRRAFRRLQEEILKRSPDTTLFAWSGGDRSLYDRQESSLFAPSPSAFAIWHINSRAPQHIAEEADPMQDDDDYDMTFAITPLGTRVYIPIVRCGESIFADLHWDGGDERGRLLLRLEADPTSQARSSRRPSYRVVSDSSGGHSRLAWVERPNTSGEYIIDGRSVVASWQRVVIK